MKPPKTTHSHIQSCTHQLMNRPYVSWRNTIGTVVMTQAFAQPNEYAAPAMRAVWTALDQHKGEEDDENRRKRR